MEPRTWLRRAGGLSRLRVQIKRGGWPYAVVNGRPLLYPGPDGTILGRRPLDPGVLCRSVRTSDECMLFTCECSEPLCGGIEIGICVVHAEGLVIWRSPDQPHQPLGVFEQGHYEAVVLAALRALLRHPPKYSGLKWTMAIGLERIRQRLEEVQAGIPRHEEG